MIAILAMHADSVDRAGRSRVVRAGGGPSVKIPKYQYVGFDFPILDEMW
jgi:hypothetical protein